MRCYVKYASGGWGGGKGGDDDTDCPAREHQGVAGVGMGVVWLVVGRAGTVTLGSGRAGGVGFIYLGVHPHVCPDRSDVGVDSFLQQCHVSC